MNEIHACSDAGFLSKVEGFDGLPGLIRLLAEGDPIDLAQLAAARGDCDIERLVRAQPGTEWDPQGRLVGFGLTTQPTDHRFVVGGRTLYTWCSTDTLLFTIIIGGESVAESTCPATGVPIRLELTPDGVASATPTETVVSQRCDDELVANLRSDVCDHGHFFASAAAAADWLAAFPDGRVLPVAEAFARCRASCEELGWLRAGTAGR
jgi:alkylmercury lyase